MKPEIDTSSGTWKFIEEYASTQLARQRERNDAVSMDAIQTAHVRGRIAELKAVLALAKAPADPADDGGLGY